MVGNTVIGSIMAPIILSYNRHAAGVWPKQPASINRSTGGLTVSANEAVLLLQARNRQRFQLACSFIERSTVSLALLCRPKVFRPFGAFQPDKDHLRFILQIQIINSRYELELI